MSSYPTTSFRISLKSLSKDRMNSEDRFWHNNEVLKSNQSEKLVSGSTQKRQKSQEKSSFGSNKEIRLKNRSSAPLFSKTNKDQQELQKLYKSPDQKLPRANRQEFRVSSGYKVKKKYSDKGKKTSEINEETSSQQHNLFLKKSKRTAPSEVQDSENAEVIEESALDSKGSAETRHKKITQNMPSNDSERTIKYQKEIDQTPENHSLNQGLCQDEQSEHSVQNLDLQDSPQDCVDNILNLLPVRDSTDQNTSPKQLTQKIQCFYPVAPEKRMNPLLQKINEEVSEEQDYPERVTQSPTSKVSESKRQPALIESFSEIESSISSIQSITHQQPAKTLTNNPVLSLDIKIEEPSFPSSKSSSKSRSKTEKASRFSRENTDGQDSLQGSLHIDHKVLSNLDETDENFSIEKSKGQSPQTKLERIQPEIIIKNTANTLLPYLNDKTIYTFADSQQNLANISLPLSPNMLGREIAN